MATVDADLAGKVVGWVVALGTFVLAALGYLTNNEAKRREEASRKEAAALAAKIETRTDRDAIIARLESENARLSKALDESESDCERHKTKAEYWEDLYDELRTWGRALYRWATEAHEGIVAKEPGYPAPPPVPSRPKDADPQTP